jgi:hypothetical protein
LWLVDLVDEGEKAVTPVGNKYKTIFVIAKHRYVMVFLHSSKDTATYEKILDTAIAQAGCTPKTLQSDGACEYNSAAMDNYYAKKNIFKCTMNPHQRFQDGMVEKMVDTISNGVRTMLSQSNLPPQFWGYATIYFVDIYNHLPHS